MAADRDNVLRRLLDALLGAAKLWSGREQFDERLVVSVMDTLVVERHRDWCARIPVYGRLAQDEGVAGMADVGEVIDSMTFSTGLFKSYEPAWLERGEFRRMTDWVADISSCRPEPPSMDVCDVETWRTQLAGQGVHLSSSSGTSGRPSFVPRDEATWRALCGNGRYYSDEPTSGSGVQGFVLLALMPRGDALGLQSAASGLARTATASHFIEGDPGDELARAGGFLADAMRQGRAVLVFGPPHAAADLCEAVLATTGSGIPLPPGSRLVTGGGWKGHRPVAREELLELVRRALRLEADAVVDAYSATELNCVLSSCPEGRYHVPPLIHPLLLDDAMEWMPEAEATGILAFFDPFAGSYPGLLATGDQGHLTREPCRCGLTGWSVRGPIVRAPGHEPRGCAGALASEPA
jgi:hypothetical protein